MKAKIMSLAILLIASCGVLRVMDNNSDVLITNDLAVAQLEDSNEAKIALDVGGRLQSYLKAGVYLMVVGAFVLVAYSERKRVFPNNHPKNKQTF